MKLSMRYMMKKQCYGTYYRDDDPQTIMLSKKKKQDHTHCMIPFIRTVQKGKQQRDKVGLWLGRIVGGNKDG